MSAPSDDDRIRRLLDVGRALLAELDPQKVLDLILEQARDITGASYAALGVLNEQRTELERFVTSGMDDATRRSIGELPRGRGVLGVLIKQPRPLRLADVGQHPLSYGFPAGHPLMHGFLGVPIMIRGEAWGNLCLAEKAEGDFTEADEDAAGILAGWAATAIENAGLYQVSERRRQELERAVHGLEATSDIVIAIGAESDLGRVLELIAQTRTGAGRRAEHVDPAARRDGSWSSPRSPATRSTSAADDCQSTNQPRGMSFKQGRSERIADVESRLRISPARSGVTDAHTGLLVPMIHRDEARGARRLQSRRRRQRVHRRR